MTNPELIMLVGLPGCGKSTWTQEFLAENKDYEVVSSDALIEEAAAEAGVTYDVAFRAIPKEVVNNAVYRRVVELVKANKNIIWDQTNLTIADRRAKLDMIPFNWRRRCVAFIVPLVEIKLRRDLREQANPGKTIPSDVIELMTEAFVFPTMVEGFDEITMIA